MSNITVDYATYLTQAPYNASDFVTIADTSTVLNALSTSAIDALSTNNVDQLSATDGFINWSASQFSHLCAGTTVIAAATVATMVDTGANITALSSTVFGQLHAHGVDAIDASDNLLTLSLAQFNALNGVTLAGGDVITLTDTQSNLQALSGASVNNLFNKGIDVFHSLSGALTVNTSQLGQFYQHPGHIFLASDVITWSSTGDDIAVNSADVLHGAMLTGVDFIDSNTDVLTLQADQYSGVYTAGTHFTVADNLTIYDSSDAIDGLLQTSGIHAELVTDGVNTFQSFDGTQNLHAASVAAVDGSGAVFFTDDTVTVVDTGANIATLNFADLTALGVDTLDATDNVLAITLTQYGNLGGLTIDASDAVVIKDTAANLEALSTTDIDNLAGHISAIAVSDANTLVLSKAQLDALAADSIALTQADTVKLSATQAAIQGLTGTQLTGYATQGVDIFDASDAATLTLSASQLSGVLATTATFADAVTLSDLGANISGLSATQFGQLAGHGVTAIDASDNTLSLSVSQYKNLGAVALAAADTITLSDTGANIASLTAAQIQALGTNHIDKIDASDNAISLAVDQAHALVNQTGTAVTVDASDTITIADTGAHITAMTVSDLTALAALGSGTLHIDASDNAYSLSVAQFDALTGFTVTSGDTLTVADTASNLGTLNTGAIAALGTAGVAAVHVSDASTAHLSEAQTDAFATAGVALTGADTFAMDISAAALDALSASALAAYATQGIDIFNVTPGGALSMTAAQISAVYGNGAVFAGQTSITVTGTLDLTVAEWQTAVAAGNVFSGGVHLADTAAHIQAVSAANLQTLTATGITVVDSNSDALTLTADQAAAFLHQTGAGTVSFSSSDTITISDTGAHIAALSSADIAALAANGAAGVVFDASDDSYSLSTAQANALGAIQLTAGDTVTVTDAEANIEALTGVQLAAYATHGVDVIGASGGTLHLSEAQVAAVLGSSTVFASGNDVTLADTGANIASLTALQIGELAASGVDHIDATNDTLSFSVAQYQALNGVTLTGADTVTLRDTGAALSGLSASDIGALAANGVDRLDSTGGSLSLSVAQAEALGTVKIATADVATLYDTGAHIAAMTQAQIGALSASGIDAIDASDDALSLTVRQWGALHRVVLAGSDNITLADTSAHISNLSAAQIAQLSTDGVDNIDVTNNSIGFTLAQYNALGSLHLNGGDTIVVNGSAGSNDVFQGHTGTLTFNGWGGDDTFFGGFGDSTFVGGNGTDTVSYAAAAEAVSVNLATGTAVTAAGTDTLNTIENVTGSAYGDTITGDGGDNVIDGGAGNDRITGGWGSDTLTGGTGADTFVYTGTADSYNRHPDTIMDFSHAEGDKIDVSGVASFTFVDHLDGHANELAVIDQGGGVYKVVGDVTGDGRADFVVFVHSGTALVSGDFIF